jgi:integral membrane protein
MNAALTRYRVMAWVVGVLLLVLVFVAMPLKYLADSPQLVSVVGMLHGFLYMVYLVAAFDLSIRARWRLWRTLIILLAGTVPVMSFVAEHYVTGWIRESTATQPASV